MLALEGVRVLDLTQHLSGPYCTMLLGDAGAEIVKIEKLSGGDDQRRLGPFIHGESSPFMMINRNKRSMTLNLKSDEGVRIFLELASGSDVIVENFRPGVADALGIGYDAVREVNPQAIYCSISGYGQTGPYREKGGFDILAQGMTGLMDLNTPVGERPVKVPISLHDIGAGMTAANAILVAYINRLKRGQGQYVDVSLVEAGLALTVQEASAFFVTGTVPKVAGTRNHLSAPYQAYRARDAYVIVGASHQKLWEKFCRHVVEMPEWIDDARFATVTDRLANADDLERMIEDVFVQQDAQHWVATMDRWGVPGGPINTYAQALSDPHVQARDMVIELEHPTAGVVRGIGIPAKLSDTPGTVRLPAPMLGQHTREILSSILGLSDSELDQLAADGVV